MKITLSKIVGRPVAVGGQIVTYAFVQALQKLAADPLPIKERYALGRTIEDVERWIKAFDGKREELLKVHCTDRKTFLQSRAAKVRSEIEQAEKGEARHPGLKRMKESLARIEAEIAECAEGQLVTETPEHAKALNEALEKAAQEEAEIFLDHKIALAEDSKLTGAEIALLLDLVEIK